jgi:hypothetical protein
MVPKSLRSSILAACWPVGSGVTRQVVIRFLYTSTPAPWKNMIAIVPSGVGGWRDPAPSRVDAACSTAQGQLATIWGALSHGGRCRGP